MSTSLSVPKTPLLSMMQAEAENIHPKNNAKSVSGSEMNTEFCRADEADYPNTTFPLVSFLSRIEIVTVARR
jgi:hypothetical protein